MKRNIHIPKKLIKRLSQYHYYLDKLQGRSRDFVSTERLANDLDLSLEEVREDFESLNDSLSISDIHSVSNLLDIVERYLGYDQENMAVIVGAGNLGKALYNFQGFRDYGLDILAMFDNDRDICGDAEGPFEIYPIERLGDLIRRLNIKVGIITTPPEAAQGIADRMVDSGILGIWNFTQARLKVPDTVELKSTSLFSEYLSLVQRMVKKTE